MSNRQLFALIGAVTLLSLILAWTIERTQVARFLGEFDDWWEAKSNGSAGTD